MLDVLDRHQQHWLGSNRRLRIKSLEVRRDRKWNLGFDRSREPSPNRSRGEDRSRAGLPRPDGSTPTRYNGQGISTEQEGQTAECYDAPSKIGQPCEQPQLVSALNRCDSTEQ